MLKDKILVADDEQSMREFLDIMLKKEGYKVSLASKWRRGIKADRERYFRFDPHGYSDAKVGRDFHIKKDQGNFARNHCDHDHRLCFC